LYHNQLECVGFDVHLSCIEVHLAVWIQDETLQTETSWNWY